MNKPAIRSPADASWTRRPFEIRPAADLNGLIQESEQRRRKDKALMP